MNDSLAPAGRGPAKQGSGRRANDPLKFRLSHPHESVPINCTSDALSGSNKRKQTKPISLKRRYEKEFLAPEAVQRIADKASTYVPLPESSDQQATLESCFDDGFERYLDGLDAAEWNQLFGPLSPSPSTQVSDSPPAVSQLAVSRADATTKRKQKEPMSLEKKASVALQKIADLASTSMLRRQPGEVGISSATLGNEAQSHFHPDGLTQLLDDVNSYAIDRSQREPSVKTRETSISTDADTSRPLREPLKEGNAEKNAPALKKSNGAAKGPSMPKLRGPRMDRRTFAARKNLWSDAVLAVSAVDPSLIDVTTGIGGENEEGSQTQRSNE